MKTYTTHLIRIHLAFLWGQWVKAAEMPVIAEAVQAQVSQIDLIRISGEDFGEYLCPVVKVPEKLAPRVKNPPTGETLEVVLHCRLDVPQETPLKAVALLAEPIGRAARLRLGTLIIRQQPHKRETIQFSRSPEADVRVVNETMADSPAAPTVKETTS